MLFRINRKNFLIHMIDHFTAKEILGMKFLLISNKMKIKSRAGNVVKCIDLTPSDETSKEFIKYQNLKLFRKSYFEDLDNSEDPLHKEVLKKVVKDGENLTIFSHEHEDQMVDVFVEYLDKKYGLQCADLNKLFEKGKIPPIKWDLSKVKNKMVDINRRVSKQQYEEDERTSDGRLKILHAMQKKHKVEKLKSLGINPKNLSESEITKILISEWVEE